MSESMSHVVFNDDEEEEDHRRGDMAMMDMDLDLDMGLGLDLGLGLELGLGSLNDASARLRYLARTNSGAGDRERRELDPLPLFFTDNYNPDPFEPTRAIEAMRSMPRYSYPSDFRALFGSTSSSSSSSSVRNEYLRGLAVGSVVLLSVFASWCVVLLALKCCCGRRRVGCASGTFRPRPPRPTPTPRAHTLPDTPQTESEAGVMKGDMSDDNWLQHDDDDGGWLARGRHGHEANKACSSPRNRSSGANVPSSLNASHARLDHHARVVRRVRILYVLAGFGVIIASILFYTKGVVSLVRSLQNVQTTLDESDVILQESVLISTAYIRSSSELRETRIQFQTEADQFCPNRATTSPENDNESDESLSSSLPSSSFDGTYAFERLLVTLEGFSSGLEGKAEDIRNDLIDVRSNVATLNDVLDRAYPFLYASVSALAVLVVIATFLILNVVFLAWKERNLCRGKNAAFGTTLMTTTTRTKKYRFLHCTKNVIILPMFVFFMLLAWLFATAFMFVAIGGSDFCSSPDANVLYALNVIQNQHVQSGLGGGRTSPSSNNNNNNNNLQINLLFELLKYYIRCNDEYASKPPDFDDELALLQRVGDAIHGFLEFVMLEESQGAMSALCQSPDGAFDSLNRTASILHLRLHVVWGVFVSIYELLSCRTINPLYEMVAHHGICINGISGLVWIFSTQLTIAVCCMIMVTLRAGSYEIGDNDDDDDEEEEEEEEEKEEYNKKAAAGRISSNARTC